MCFRCSKCQTPESVIGEVEMSPWKLAEKARRGLRTMFFVVAMAASLLASSLPVLVAVADVAVTWAVISSLTCLTCCGVGDHLRQYSFRISLIDVPFVSSFRSLAFICLSYLCHDPAVAHGPYLGMVSLCSFGSILLVSLKACVFTHMEVEEASSSSSVEWPKAHLKNSWGMPILLLSFVIFGFTHVFVAYRAKCRARRKLLYHKIDQEAVLSCKMGFSGYQKAHWRSLTFSSEKMLMYDSELMRNPFRGTASAWKGEEGLQPRALAGPDSLFITIRGLTLHYKLCLPCGPPPHNLSTQETGVRRLRLDKQVSNVTSQPRRHHLHRSYSIQLDKSSLYDPLLNSYLTSPISMFHTYQNNDVNHQLGSTSPTGPLDGNGRFGVVLVHGFGGGVFQWRHVMGELSQQLCCPVAAFDRPGWGLTSRLFRKDLPNPYMLESQVDLLLSFCSEMGFSSVVLVGHDDGGLLALRAAERVQAPTSNNSISIKGVVLLNVSLSREVVPPFARILLYTSLRKKHLVRPLLRTEITQVVSRRAWCDTAKLTTDTLMLYKAPLCVEAWDEALSEISRLSYEMVLSSQNAASLLKSIGDLPILVVAGAEDALIPLKSAQVLASKLANSRLVAINGCGHLPHEESPEALVSALTSFISRLVPRPPET
ncbi:PREDICTED: uncharacterized protein LOC104815542 isoform X2 [Tarenaya hassleriana]|uniref:uncharacterized protein LOC104815542 isoform X2 n=1 Tax=Tarenaya hassleriana TaxID=28532 RepID=UPI00053C2829|nr:PREDICTED: uncharacterized protein LOC104815542 isoform X2 [Tarenaya hassleriana]